MLEKIILFSGSSAVGKTSLIKWLIPYLKEATLEVSLCKIDCFDNKEKVKDIDIPYLLAASNDICPDHFLVSNLPELWSWSLKNESNTLMIETAGLCHRCSPASEKMIAGCIVDCTSSTKAPQSLGPMLLFADFVVVTKIDMVSQAEREIILWKIGQLNPSAQLFAVDNLAGYGIQPLVQYLIQCQAQASFEGDKLRNTMPMGVCSYCVGECRVGSDFQQGIISKIEVN